jgi:hypothetical protein
VRGGAQAAHRHGKSGTAGTVASCGARARAPGQGRTEGERRRPGAGHGGATGARRAGRTAGRRRKRMHGGLGPAAATRHPGEGEATGKKRPHNL